MPSHPRRLLAPSSIAIWLTVILVAGGCSRTSAGDNYLFTSNQLSAAPASTAPTVPPETPKDPLETEIATAAVGEVEVFLQKPGSPPTTPTTATTPSRMPAIPRDGFQSAGVRKTATGMAYSNPTYYKNSLVFIVLGKEDNWINVMLPARPNGQSGWVKASDVTLSRTKFRMVLTLGDTTLKVWNGNDVFAETKVVIGKQASKTPVGKFYLNEKVKSDNPSGAYGPWILSTSGYSEDLDQFDGGLPVVAFHGTNQPNLIGQRVSNGCIRMPNEIDIKLADALPAGTPIIITA